MKDLKILVANEAENKEAQELFFKLGYYWAYKNLGKKLLLSKNNVYLFAESDGTLGTGTHQDEVFFNNWRGKEITLQELRDMVNPMREYLEPSNNYSLIKAHRKEGSDWIEVPEWANYAYDNDQDVCFLIHEIKYKLPLLLWQRYTQPEELPFVDSLPEFKHDFGASSLNDQYAEIEQVRQQTIEATLAERQAQYGCFEDVARTTGKIMEALSEVRVNGLNDLPYPHRMALYMIASKMARIVNGNYNHKDSWHDIGGYSKLIEDLL